MKNRFLACILFAVIMMLIPLIAVKNPQPVAFSPPQAVPGAPQGTDGTAQPQNPQAPQESDGLPAQTQENQGAPADPAQEEEAAPAPEKTQQTAVLPVEDSFRILDERTGRILNVSAKDYTRGALAAELPPTFHPEALKAQAVAAHTYALCQKQQRAAAPEASLHGADFSADPESWKRYTTEKVFRARYGDLADSYWNAICEAADGVNSYVLIYEGEPIVAAYHSMSSGVTEDAGNVWTGSVPYLVPVESRGDLLAPDYETTETFSRADMEKALKSAYPAIKLPEDASSWFRIEERSEGGYVLRLTAGNETLHGKELRTLLGLRSSNFDITYQGGAFAFTVRGYGHGVGLSQYGADYLARQGMDFEEILAHYYPGARLAVLANDADSSN